MSRSATPPPREGGPSCLWVQAQFSWGFFGWWVGILFLALSSSPGPPYLRGVLLQKTPLPLPDAPSRGAGSPPAPPGSLLRESLGVSPAKIITIKKGGRGMLFPSPHSPSYRAGTTNQAGVPGSRAAAGVCHRRAKWVSGCPGSPHREGIWGEKMVPCCPFMRHPIQRPAAGARCRLPGSAPPRRDTVRELRRRGGPRWRPYSPGRPRGCAPCSALAAPIHRFVLGNTRRILIAATSN